MRRFVPLLALALVVVTAQPSAAQRTGGVLKAGMIGEPPSLDIHWTTAVITQQITWHAVETLYTYDRVFNVVPLLAEGDGGADGGRRYTIRLRKGVKFHTGKEMTSADVVASLMRWGKMAGTGKAMWKNVEAVEAKDPLTVVIHMKQPSGVLLAALARRRSEEHTSELQSRGHLVCRLLLEKNNRVSSHARIRRFPTSHLRN